MPLHSVGGTSREEWYGTKGKGIPTAGKGSPDIEKVIGDVEDLVEEVSGSVEVFSMLESGWSQCCLYSSRSRV